MFKISDLQSQEASLRGLKARSRIILFFLILISLAGVIQIVKLTVIDQENYVTESEKNRIIRVPVYPSRGLIGLAKDNKLLVENIVAQQLTINFKSTTDIASTIVDIQKTIGIPEEVVRTFYKVLSSNPRNRNITLMDDLSEEQVAKYLVNKERWPSSNLEAYLKRYVIDNSLFSHVVGYTGAISSQEREDDEEYRYSINSRLGKSGIEKTFENELRGKVGYRTVEVDVHGKEVRELEKVLPSKAKNIYLSLDQELQELARKGLRGRKGAVVAIDPNNGLVKVLVSSPDFNPNIFNETAKGDLRSLSSDSNAPFFNRAISGNYPPASTLKPFLGLLGLESEIISWNTEIKDEGFFQIQDKGRKYRGWKEEGHGIVDLNKAIIESSDVYFYELASKTTVDQIHSFLKPFGFGQKTGIQLTGEEEGVLPSRNWKLGRTGDSWFVGDTINLGIGQGYMTTTPLQLAVAVSVLATRGKAYKPKIVEKIDTTFIEPELLYQIEVKEERNWKKLEESMISVIRSWNGTAHNIYNPDDFLIAGKTGTAQIKSLTEENLTVQEEYENVRKDIKKRDHAIFVGYGPIPNPNLTVVVVVENGESGSAVAAPIAKLIIDRYQKYQESDV
ncbi:penicillin-binding protein 2 [Gammaproteobacteria bacterium]|nr:penicillin-binding protein 2 [Gammaproteobacteria bacterium]